MLSVSALPQSPRPAEPHQYFGPTNSSSLVTAREWAAYAVDDAAAIGMEGTARQSARMAGHDLLLPRFEFDAASVLPPDSMLRKQAKPVL